MLSRAAAKHLVSVQDIRNLSGALRPQDDMLGVYEARRITRFIDNPTGILKARRGLCAECNGRPKDRFLEGKEALRDGGAQRGSS